MGPHQSESAAAAAAASITDSSRARELYKYFQPPRPPYNTVSVTRSGVPCTVLTAHAQLVAWRLNAQRALVSLIDRETQYFVAESTKTLDLANSEEYEAPNDAVWAGVRRASPATFRFDPSPNQLHCSASACPRLVACASIPLSRARAPMGHLPASKSWT